mgnify:CR=1 FL=1
MLNYLTKDDLPDGVVDIVDVIGMDAFKDLVKFAGGSNLYIPNESSLVKGVRNRIIRDSFDGNYKKVSRKFGISTTQVRNIVNYKWLNTPSRILMGYCCLSITYNPY